MCYYIWHTRCFFQLFDIIYKMYVIWVEITFQIIGDMYYMPDIALVHFQLKIFSQHHFALDLFSKTAQSSFRKRCYRYTDWRFTLIRNKINSMLITTFLQTMAAKNFEIINFLMIFLKFWIPLKYNNHFLKWYNVAKLKFHIRRMNFERSEY